MIAGSDIMSDFELSSNDENNNDRWYDKLDIEWDLKRRSRIIDVESNNRDQYNKECLKSLISHFDLLYYDKYKMKVTSTYHCDWNKYLMFLFCRFPNWKYQVISFGNVDNGRPAYTCEDHILEFYREYVVGWMVEQKTVQRMSYALDALIKAENSNDTYWSLKKSAVWGECQTCINEQRSNYSAYQRDLNRTTHLDPGVSIKKTVTRNDLLKIVTAWVEGFADFDPVRLEVLFSCLWCYKTLVRYGSLESLQFRCLQMQKVDDDPDFLSIIVPRDFEKNKKNPSYPSCTFRDKNPLLCSQFFLCMLIIKTMDERGIEMSFCNASIAKRSWWGYMMILFKLKDPSTARNHFKVLCKKSNVTTDKILHQKSSGLYELTKHANIMLYAINIVSRHEIDKPFYAYVNWFQPLIF